MIRSVIAPAILVLSLISARAEGDLLAYWNFNNSAKDTETSLGTFKNEPALFGETFDPQTKHLSANTNFDTVFNGPEIYLDLSSLASKEGGAVRHSWGVFIDTKVNKLRQDDTQGGSFMVGASENGNSMTFVLSTEGYKNLILTYAHRANDAAVMQWSYSLDGKTFNPIKEIDRTTAFSKETLYLSAEGEGALGLDQLNDKKTIYLRVTFVFPSAPSGSLALDNVQLTGTK
jgi:hypothetical protein